MASSVSSACTPVVTITDLDSLVDFLNDESLGVYTQAQVNCVVQHTATGPLINESNHLGDEFGYLSQMLDLTPKLSPNYWGTVQYEYVESLMDQVIGSPLEGILGMGAADCAADPTCAFLAADDFDEATKAVQNEYNKANGGYKEVLKVHNQSVEFYNSGVEYLKGPGPDPTLPKKILLNRLATRELQAKYLKELRTKITDGSLPKLTAAQAKFNEAFQALSEAGELTGEAKKAKLAEASAAIKATAGSIKEAKNDTDDQKQIRINYSTAGSNFKD